MDIENYFGRFRENIIGIDATFETPFGVKPVIYADWIASGRLYRPIEGKLMNEFGPFVANTHTETSETGIRMTNAYHHSHALIKKYVNANANDVIITAGFGMTAVVNKFQRILGLKYCSLKSDKNCMKDRDRPVVFLTHMEHHSNHTSWYETNADVVVVEPDEDLLVSTDKLREALSHYSDRKFKIGSFTACSNVTGIRTPYHEMARIMHENGGVCFIDFAASAPYEEINMHPDDPMEKLDAVLFSPHKFLGGPGSSGVLVFDKTMYKSEVPDNPGGGTVDWTNPWGQYKYVDDIEAREDGGTPGFLQSIKTALAFELKNAMGLDAIKLREELLLKRVFDGLDAIAGVHILASRQRSRLGVVSFYVADMHYNLVVRLLNDLYGIQVRGGCACAGTYGHFLLEVSHEKSDLITQKITMGDLTEKPGWIRWSLHPTTTVNEVDLLLEGIEYISKNRFSLEKMYNYLPRKNAFFHKSDNQNGALVANWFKL